MRQSILYCLHYQIVCHTACHGIHRLERIAYSLVLLHLIHHRLLHHISAALWLNMSVKYKMPSLHKLRLKVWHAVPYKLYHMPGRTDILQCNLHSRCIFHYRRLFNHSMDGIGAAFVYIIQFINIRYFRKLYIIPGKMKEYITNGVYSHFSKCFLCFFPDALNCGNR